MIPTEHLILFKNNKFIDNYLNRIRLKSLTFFTRELFVLKNSAKHFQMHRYSFLRFSKLIAYN